VDPFEVYQSLAESPTETDLYRLAEAVTPLIQAKVRSYECDHLTKDGIVNQALAVVLRRAQQRAFPQQRGDFEPFLTTTISNAVRGAFRDQAPFDLPGDAVDEAVTDSPIDPDLAHTIRHLPDYVAGLVLTRVRHPELTPGLTKYIVRSLLTGETISSNVLEKYGGLSHVGYYVGYIRVLVRWALYEIRDTLRETDGSTTTR